MVTNRVLGGLLFATLGLSGGAAGCLYAESPPDPHRARCGPQQDLPDAAVSGVDVRGLVMHFDFSRGSLPDRRGRIRDLSPHKIDGVMRPLLPIRPVIPRSGWGVHRIFQGNGHGGWVARPAQIQALRDPDSTQTMPFGMVYMENRQLALMCSAEGNPTRPVITFSHDGGDTWSDFSEIPNVTGRPMMLTDHGGGTLSFVTDRRYFSHDYGRTWSDRVAHPPTRQGFPFHQEGNGWVDRDPAGKARAILELGWHYEPGKSHPRDDATVVFRRSVDGGRTWIDEVAPPQWKFTMAHRGKKWLRGVSEGAIVRAANGDLVAALRSDMPPRFFEGLHDDSLEGTAISISKDDGKTWSKLQFLSYAGRHHANLQRLASGDLVCTLIVRDDIEDLQLASFRRGCDALVSRDHGRTWNPKRRYELDSYYYKRGDGNWVPGQCGHIGATVLPDGNVISAYGHYLKGAAVLIKWRPDAEPATAVQREVTDLEIPSEPNVLTQVAQPRVDYRVRERALLLTGRSWIDIPLQRRLAALGHNGTIELIIEPTKQGGMPILVGCTAPRVNGFRIAYDQRNTDSSPQVLYSDQRVKAESLEYSIQVASQSDPPAFSTERQQIAYVMRDGHGTFFCDGRRFGKQSETGDNGSLFRYTVAQSGSNNQLRVSIGALVQGSFASNAFRGALFAVRIYDRPLSAAELTRNWTASRSR